MASYLYILSRPHSGSTILDMLLSHSREVFGCGEIITGLRLRHRKWQCSCGAEMAHCPFWSEVRRRVEAAGVDWEDLAEAHLRQSHKFDLLATFRACRDPGRAPARFQKLARFTRCLRDVIAEVAQRPIVLDSSKTPSRGLFLFRFLPDTKIVYITRDPRNILASYWWRMPINDTYLVQRRPYHGPLRWLAAVEIGILWTLGNLLNEAICALDRKRAVRIRYEDLRDEPERMMRELGAFLDIDATPVIAAIARTAPLKRGHLLGGSPIRIESEARFDPNRELKRAPPPTALRWLVTAICWPMMLRYGYPLRAPRHPRTVGGPEHSGTAAPNSAE